MASALRAVLRACSLFILFTAFEHWGLVDFAPAAQAQAAPNAVTPPGAAIPPGTGNPPTDVPRPTLPNGYSPGRHAMKPATFGPEDTKRMLDSRPLDPHLLPSQLQHSVTGVPEPKNPRNDSFRRKDQPNSFGVPVTPP